jgi:hypothetical protein
VRGEPRLGRPAIQSSTPQLQIRPVDRLAFHGGPGRPLVAPLIVPERNWGLHYTRPCPPQATNRPETQRKGSSRKDFGTLGT